MIPRTNGLVSGALILVVLVTVCFRLFGPSDVYEKTQPKTMAYTADMAANQRYLLPRDVTGAPATKPPLYNWLALPVVGWLGVVGEIGHKTPALLSGAILLVVTLWTARRLFQGPSAGSGTTAALLTGCVFAASPETFKWIYIARPDGVLMALLAGAWAASTAILEGWTERRAPWAAVFWVCIGAGVLAKGPVGLLPLVYAAALARLRHGGFRRLGLLHCWWGAPVALLMVAAWAVPAWLTEPDHCREIFLGRELVYHVAGDQAGGPIVGWAGSIVKSPLYFVLRFLPWSVFVVIGLTAIRPRNWISHPLGPAILWCATVIVPFCFVAMVKHRYLAPAYPAAAVLAVHGALTTFRNPSRTAAALTTLSLVVCIGLGVHNLFWSNAARFSFGDAATRFAREARGIVGEDPVAFLIHGNSPVQALMGRNQPDNADEEAGTAARWVVAPIARAAEMQGAEPEAVSQPMPRVIPGEPEAATPIALFPRPGALQQEEPDEIRAKD